MLNKLEQTFYAMLQDLPKQCERHLFYSGLDLILALIFNLICRVRHPIIASILIAIGFFCGLWFVDIIYSSKGNESNLIYPLLIFLISFFILSCIVYFLGYQYGIISTIVSFLSTMIIENVFKQYKKE